MVAGRKCAEFAINTSWHFPSYLHLMPTHRRAARGWCSFNDHIAIAVSRLTDLIAETKAKNPQLGADLEREFRTLSSRVPFGLNFERHRPEAVELPHRAPW